MEVNEEIRALRAQAKKSFQRRIVLLSGPREWGQAQASRAESLFDQEACLWLGDEDTNLGPYVSPDPNLQGSYLPFAKAKTLLGSERDLVVFDAWAGFDPNAFGIASGILKGGGIFLLLCPPLNEWPGFRDPQYRRIQVWPNDPATLQGAFLQRLSSLVREASEITVIEAAGGVRPFEPVLETVRAQAHDEPVETPFASYDQQKAVSQMVHVVKGHRRRPLVLTADRGRGKSSAMGMAAAQLLLGGIGRVTVTAPSFEAVKPLFVWAETLLKDVVSVTGAGTRLYFDKGELVFVPPDELVLELPPSGMVMVDEAAAIPVAILEGLLRHYSRLAFATTVHGYEGTGRGFSVRFKSRLDELTPQWRDLEMRQPVRWADDDPLEAFTSRALLLDAEPAQLVTEEQWGEVEFSWVDGQTLARDESRLRELFGLLVLAHYQTSPLDLRHLLDGPNIQVCIASLASRVVGAVMVATEGGFDTSLAEGIFNGERRPQGHLLPQTLLVNGGGSGAGALRCLRVVRIAVLPSLQRQGTGKRLLECGEAKAKEEGIDYTGAVFGLSEATWSFWRSASYAAVHLGSRKNAGSGEYSLAVIRGVSEEGIALESQLKSCFREVFPRLLGSLFIGLESALATNLLASLTAEDSPAELSAVQMSMVDSYAHHRRSYESSLFALQCFLSRVLCDANLAGLSAEDDSDRSLLVGKILQNRRWEEIAASHSFTGRKAVEAALRNAISRLYRRFMLR
ncbi:MAG: tRNA(Met) cytidine acetyltransferase TmcA [bacterium]